MNNITKLALLALTVVPAFAAAGPLPSAPLAAPAMAVTMAPVTGSFSGIEVKGGTATLVKEMGKRIIRLSSDFAIPKSPAPHFQIVDGKGNVYLLSRLTLVGDKTRREVVLPGYIKDVKKVQIWCSFAEVLLGEASFTTPVSGR